MAQWHTEENRSSKKKDEQINEKLDFLHISLLLSVKLLKNCPKIIYQAVQSVSDSCLEPELTLNVLAIDLDELLRQ